MHIIKVIDIVENSMKEIVTTAPLFNAILWFNTDANNSNINATDSNVSAGRCAPSSFHLLEHRSRQCVGEVFDNVTDVHRVSVR
jgi:hypothetical protein